MIPFNHLGFLFKTFGPMIYSDSVRKSLCDFLQPIATTASVLDIGGGTGVMSEFAHTCRDDFEYTVVDPAEEMLKHVKEYMKPCKANAEALPFDDKRFDVVLMGEALHHFDDVEESLKETVRVLKRGGKLFIYDFDVSTFRGGVISRVESLFGEPANFFQPEALLTVLESHGFSVGFKRHGWRYTMHAQLK